MPHQFNLEAFENGKYHFFIVRIDFQDRSMKVTLSQKDENGNFFISDDAPLKSFEDIPLSSELITGIIGNLAP